MAGNMSSLEQQLHELEVIATKLEAGNMTIDDAIVAYAKAMELAVSCRKSLENMEQKIALAKQNAQEKFTNALNTDNVVNQQG